MSTTIDQRVVEMRFDNKQFEANVATTMSTLSKLKQSLNFTGAAKGLDGLSDSAKKVDMNTLGNAVETVRSRFSALEVMGITALANLTNSAVNAGKRIVSALTIEPITTGFSEYELKMGSVQTIMAGTGESLETVNKYLEELNKYSDQTIYSFSDMTSNIGKFTNAGVKLEDAVMAIKGISNEAAVSGANANEASRAMYNFAQALSAGYVKLIDWKSIENANMATMEFKNELIDTALKLGTIVKVGDKYQTTTTNLQGKVSDLFDATSMFNDSLAHQWMTTDVLVETLGRYADETTDIGKKAAAAATEVKTLTQLWGVLKESAQSGWAQTWELIVGDFNEAKSLFTVISETVGGIIDAVSDARNNLLKGALASPFDRLTKKVEEAGVSVEDFNNALINVARKRKLPIDDWIKKYGSLSETIRKEGWLTSGIIVEAFDTLIGKTGKASASTEELNAKFKKFKDVVADVWLGKYDNGKDRVEALTKAGYNYAEVQELVNKCEKGRALTLADLNDEELKALGYTKAQIAQIKELRKAAIAAGDDFDDMMRKADGRTLLLDSFGNIWKSLKQIFEAITDAWNNIFPPKPIEERQEALYNLIDAFNEFTKTLKLSVPTQLKLTKTFKGLFAILDIIGTITGGFVRAGFEVLCAVLETFGLDILDVTAFIGDAAVAVRDWIDEHNLLLIIVKKVAQKFAEGIKDVKKWIEEFKTLPIVTDAIIAIQDAFKKASETIGGFFSEGLEAISAFFDEIGAADALSLDNLSNSISGFFRSIETAVIVMGGPLAIVRKWIKVLQNVFQLDFIGMTARVGKMLASFRDWLVTNNGLMTSLQNAGKKIGEFISNLITGIKDLVKQFAELPFVQEFWTSFVKEIKETGGKIAKWFEELIDISSDFVTTIGELDKLTFSGLLGALKTFGSRLWDHVIGFGGLFGGLFALLKKFKDGLKNFFEDASGKIDTAGDNISKVVGVIWDKLKEVYGRIRDFFSEDGWDKIVNIAKTGILLAFLWQFYSAMKNLANLPNSISNMFDSISNIFGGKKTKGEEFKDIAIAVGILAGAITLLANLDWKKAWPAAVAVAGILGVLFAIQAGLTALGGKYGGVAGFNATGFGVAMLSLSAGIIILIGALKLLETVDVNSVSSNIGVLGQLLLQLVTASSILALVNSKFGNGTKGLIKLSVALLLFVGVVKIYAMLDWSTLDAGLGNLIIVLTTLGTFLAVVGAFTKGSAMGGAALAILSVVAAMWLLRDVLEVYNNLDWENFKQGIINVGLIAAAILAFSFLMSKVDFKNNEGMFKSLMSLAIGIVALTGAVMIFSLLPFGALMQGILGVSILLLALGAALKLAAGITTGKQITGIVLMITAIVTMTAALFFLKDIPWDQLIGAATSLGLLLMMLGAALAVSSMYSSISSAGALVIASVGIVAIAAALKLLAGIPLKSLIDGVIGIGLAMVVLIAASAGIQYFAAGAAVLVGVLGSFSLSMLTTAISAAVFSAALYILGLALPLIGEGFTAIGVGLYNMITHIASCSTSVDEFAQVMLVLASSIVVFGAAVALLGAGLVIGAVGFAAMGLAAIVAGAGVLVFGSAMSVVLYFLSLIGPGLSDVGKGIGDLVRYIGESYGYIGEFAAVMVVASLGAIVFGASCVVLGAGLVLAGAGAAVAGLGVLVLAGSMYVLGAGIMFVGEAIAYIVKLFTGVEVEAQNVGTNITAGMANGIESTQISVFDIVAGMVGGVVNKICELLGIHSPSTVMEELGIYTGQGYANGLEKSTSGVSEASSNMANAVTSNFDISELTGQLGTDAATSYADGISGSAFLSDYASMDLASITSGNFDISSLTSQFGSDAVSSFAGGITDNTMLADFASLDLASMTSGNFDISSLTSQFGSDAASSYASGITGGNGDASTAGSDLKGSVLSTLVDSTGSFSTEGFTAGNAYATSLSAGASSGTQSMQDVLSSMRGEMASSQPSFREGGTALMTSFIEGINVKHSECIIAVKQISDAMLKLMNGRQQEFFISAKTVMAGFILGVDYKGKALTATVNTMILNMLTKINGYYTSFYNAGCDLVSGFSNGIEDSTFLAEIKAEAMALAAAEAAKEALRENSPSKVGYWIGDYFGVGFVNGISDNIANSAASGEEIAEAAKNSLSNAISKISALVEDGIDTSPVIRPVLDLSNVESGSRKLNALFSRTQAVSISSSMNRAKAAEIQNGVVEPSTKGNNFNFVQNNYSPKALSRVEIYRQTKNQFSAMERMVEK